jgi:hypothetical protein
MHRLLKYSLPADHRIINGEGSGVLLSQDQRRTYKRPGVEKWYPERPALAANTFTSLLLWLPPCVGQQR